MSYNSISWELGVPLTLRRVHISGQKMLKKKKKKKVKSGNVIYFNVIE